MYVNLRQDNDGSPHGFLHGHGWTTQVLSKRTLHPVADSGVQSMVGSFTPRKKVSWDDEIRNIWKRKIHVPNHQSAIHSRVSIWIFNIYHHLPTPCALRHGRRHGRGHKGSSTLLLMFFKWKFMLVNWLVCALCFWGCFWVPNITLMLPVSHVSRASYVTLPRCCQMTLTKLPVH